MVMVVLEAAVTLSPMFITTGLPSRKGISFPNSGTSTVGLVGSEKDSKKMGLYLISVQTLLVSCKMQCYTLLLTVYRKASTSEQMPE